jgi:hypothetical protein
VDKLRNGPVLVAHCDWSVQSSKRWMAVATRENDRWVIGLPELVGLHDDFFSRLNNRSPETGSMLVGFDFPLGLPRRYGERAKLDGFRVALSKLGRGEWIDWFKVAESASKIGLARPFYPLRPGGTKRSHLSDALGLPIEALHRECERETLSRRAACPLFWTLGGNQVGKAAISGWRDLIIPNLENLALWPFDGRLSDLCRMKKTVIAETYPAEAYGHLGIARNPVWSKRTQAGRRSVASSLTCWAGDRPYELAPSLVNAIADGFGGSGVGEDQFDAVLGLFAMIDVVEGYRVEGNPQHPGVLRWEGWILGQHVRER